LILPLRAREGRVVQAEAALWVVERVFGVSREGVGPRERQRVLKRELEIKEHVMGRMLFVYVPLSFVVLEALCIDFALFCW
jgi:hypothetical protein